MSLNKNKNKNKSYAKAGRVFSTTGWDPEMEAWTELPNFFEISSWRNDLIGPPPGPDQTAEEIEELLDKQERLQNPSEWLIRKSEIEFEAKEDCPHIRRLLAFPPSGSFASTEVLIRAMFQLATIVGVFYKKKYLRARPSQVDSRLRPIIDVPSWASYPSGHAVQYFLVAKALATVVHSDELSNELFKIAQRVAENREWAGLHFRSDTLAGKQLAFTIFPTVTEAYRKTFQNAAREWI